MKESPDYSEKEIFDLVAVGDEKAFYRIYTIYRPQLRGFALGMTHSDEDADDILQETFLRIWLNRDKLQQVSDHRAWIFTINARVCLNYIRRDLNQQKKISRLQGKMQAAPPTPFDIAHLDEIQALVTEAVRVMPQQRRRIFCMSRDEGKKPAEIAQELNLSGTTVRNVLSIALKEIREKLTAAGFGELSLLYLFFKLL